VIRLRKRGCNFGNSLFQPFYFLNRTLHHNGAFYCAVQARPSKRTESLENTIIALLTFPETAQNSLFFVQNDGDFLHLFLFEILSSSERAKNVFFLFELLFTMTLYKSENN